MAEVSGGEHIAGAGCPNVGERWRRFLGMFQAVVQLVIGDEHRIEHGDVDVLAHAGAVAHPQRGQRRHKAV